MKHFTRVKMGVGGKWREEREKCTAKCLCLLNTHRSAVWNWAEMGKPRIPPVVIELPTLLMHSSRLAEFSCHCRAHIWYGQHALIILEITLKYLLILGAVSPWDWGPYCPATRPCSFRSIFGAQVLYQTWCSYCASPVRLCGRLDSRAVTCRFPSRTVSSFLKVLGTKFLQKTNLQWSQPPHDMPYVQVPNTDLGMQ